MRARVQKGDGTDWLVVDRKGNTLRTCQTNSAAWHEADRINKEPVNRSEETADWSFNQKANGQ